MSELKPCPFCGAEAELRTRKDNAKYMDRLFYRYRCKKCHATVGRWSACINEREWGAEQIWNMRYDDTPQTEPQYDFGAYADRLWKIAYERGKREALEQTEPSCDTCDFKDTTEWCKRQEVCRAYKPKTEPQTSCKTCRYGEVDEGYVRCAYYSKADRKTEPRKEQNFCGKCRYLYRDFKYGLSCYRLMDNEPCKYEDRKTENSSEIPNNCEDLQDWKDRMWAEAVIAPQTEREGE